MQQLDRNGRLMDGAKLYLYVGGTTTPLNGFKDSALNSVHPWPISADASGRLPLIYLDDGYYKHKLTTKDGDTVFQDDGIPVLSETGGGGGGGGSVDPNALFGTRDIKIRFDDGPIPGYVRLNGRTIGNASSGATERANADTQALYTELWPYANITVVGGKGSTALSDFNAGKPLVLPNMAGRAACAMDDMGAGAQGVLTTLSVTTPAHPGGIGGFQTRTLTQANVPYYVLTGGAGNVSASGTTGGMLANVSHTHTGTTGTESAEHKHNYGDAQNKDGAADNGSDIQNIWSGAALSTNTSAELQSHYHPFTTDATNLDHTHNVDVTGYATSVSIESGGSGAAFVALSPVMLFMFYISL
jgi:hypothetical protein